MKPTITLCMIVKNESHVILECLNSVWKHINYWVISDTGSTDNTKELITNFFREKNIPGEFADCEWKDFAHNRTYVIRACKGKADYAWVIDADDYLEGSFNLPQDLSVDCYRLKINHNSTSQYREQIFKLESNWHWVGVVHEYADCKKENPKYEILKGPYSIRARIIGGRSKGLSETEKYARDAKILEEAVKLEPENSRYWFYLGQSYYDSENYEKAKWAYLRRAELEKGWHCERAYAYYRAGICEEYLKSWDGDRNAIELYLKAHETDSKRPEFLWQISRLYHIKYKKYHQAFIYMKIAYDMECPTDTLFINNYICKFSILDEISILAPIVGQPELAKSALKILLGKNKDFIPESELSRIKENYNILNNNK